MKVSRTVVREALMLLEEGGLIRARRGVGRFVADTLPPSESGGSAPSRKSLAAPASTSRSNASNGSGGPPPSSWPRAWSPPPAAGSGSLS
jgi:DNA-binding transcriptional MocR family regulator